MPLLSFWASNPDAVNQLTIEQVVANAGDGVIKDQSKCSVELREYLGQIPIEKIGAYVEHCLTISFNKSGQVLQDLVNELGRRLDYTVTDGLYQGVVNAVGFDGIWLSPEGHALIVEVKTTDVYRLSLDTLATYRAKLIAAGRIVGTSSIVIVVGRQDTGELEAQIRGSRHAWDVRVISAEALINLVALKQNTEAPETGRKIRSLFVPVEYTRLDRMVDVMFATVADSEPTVTSDAVDGSSSVPMVSAVATLAEPAARDVLQDKRTRIVAALSVREGAPLIRRSRALYGNDVHAVRAACGMSKRYDSFIQYWYAFHPQWQAYLAHVERSFYVLGCMDLDHAYAIPYRTLVPLLPLLNTTTAKDSTYWHIHLRQVSGELILNIPHATGLTLEPFRVTIAQ